MTDEKKNLPIRIVQPSREFVNKNKSSWAEKKVFIEGEEFEKHKENLIQKISSISSSLVTSFEKYPSIPTVLKAKLRDDALAKSHRPNGILNKDTCPIIGTDKVGELLISSTKSGIRNLSKKLKEPENPEQIANISAVEDFQEYGSNDKLQGLSLRNLIEVATRGKKTYLKVTLFNHKDEETNAELEKQFEQLLEGMDVDYENISKLEGLNLWRIIGVDEKNINEIISHPSVRTVSFFPKFVLIKPDSTSKGKIALALPQADSSHIYPIVAIIDSGISQNNPYLSTWVKDTFPYVPTSYQDNHHGTFVAGLVVMANRLNSEGFCVENEIVQVIDIQMIPDNSKDSLYEDDVIARLQDVVPKVLKKYDVKIWNMSAGFKTLISNENFSSLAIILDKLQDEYGIIFVLPSGNYDKNPQRTWPPQQVIGDRDKIQIPGDSVRAITVGALACKEDFSSIVKKDQPTSYSCRGPGPVSIVKPELVHYSGNLSLNNGNGTARIQGIKSFDVDGSITEDLGTSFSTPLISRTLSILYNYLSNDPSIPLLKALTVHNSFVPPSVSSDDMSFPYVGYGLPKDVASFFSCDKTNITLVFDHEIYQGTTMFYPFPWPKSLQDAKGNCRGKVRITLVAEVPLDANYGSEYIRGNVEVRFQSFSGHGKAGKEQWKDRIDEYPNKEGFESFFESKLVKNGYKWKPIKRFETEFTRIKALDWRIKVSLLLRDGTVLSNKPVKFALIFSLEDPKNIAPVYDEVVLELPNKGLITTPIVLKSRIREKA